MRDFRLEILRDTIPIGALRCKNVTIKYDAGAAVKRGMQCVLSAVFADMYEIKTKVRDWVYFDGTRQFDDTWCFVDAIYETSTYSFDMFSDRLRPVLIIDGEEYPLGKFMIISAPQTYAETGNHYSIEAYDETMLLKQAALTDRTFYAAGTKYQAIIENLLTDCGFANVLADETSATLPISREFDIGTTYLDVINELLSEINYNPVHQGANGTIYLTKKENKQTADFVYRDQSNIFNILDTIEETKDIYQKPNVIVGVLSNPQQTPVTYTRENNDPNSVLSIGRRGYKVVKVYKLSNMATTADLQAYIDAELLKAMQTTETVKFSTQAEAGHEYGSTVQLATNLTNGLYTETEWEINITVNSMRMTHNAERRVFV